MDVLDEARLNFLLIDSNLCDYASKSGDALRIEKMEEDFRTPYFRDVDRIIHSLSYTRYLDKTQVYSFKSNDHVSKRIVHVQLVSKIARTIGRALRLNTDLIEAISLGHDIGHTPLGHMGESILNEISQKELGEYFSHNVQSMRCYMNIENNGLGLNLTIQTLDGILCHNGEELCQVYKPVPKTLDDVLEQYRNSYKNRDANNTFAMTLEGCVVRLCDVISYIGRDLEDAINLGKQIFSKVNSKIDESKNGVMFLWNDDNKSVRNEVDVVAVKDSVPIFISCKDSDKYNEMALNELNVYASKFGGENSYKFLVATKEPIKSPVSIRAKEMGIHLIIFDGDEDKFIRTIKAII